MKKIKLSVIIPVFNEDKRLSNLIEVRDFLNSLQISSELLIINDGSEKKYLKKLTQLKKDLGFRLVSYEKNRGKGYAIKKGILESSGERILMCDVDLSVPLSEVKKFLSLSEKNGVIIGSRRTKGAKIKKHQPIFREKMGSVYTLISQKILGLKISDFTCGFKMFRKEESRHVFKRSRINRWGYDSEIIFISKKLGFGIKEVPVLWKHSEETKVRFPRDIISSFIELMTIRLNDLRGFYK